MELLDEQTENKRFIEMLIYQADIPKKISELRKINNPKLLFMFSYDYNWDDGFTIPFEIIKNPCCDMSTALLLFERSEGYEFLPDPSSDIDDDKEQAAFVKELYNRIVKNDFMLGQTAYQPVTSKVQIYKLKKLNPKVSDIFIKGIKLPEDI